MRLRKSMSNRVSQSRKMNALKGLCSAALIIFALSSPLALNGCKKPGTVPPTAPPPVVTIAKPLQQDDLIEWDTYNGYLEAKESVNVSARVSGMIEEAPFEEGSLVTKKQVLFRLDDRPFKADLALKLADVNKAKAQVAISQLNYDRMEDAKKRGVASQQDFDTAKAEWDKSLAALAGAHSALEI